MHLVTFRRFRWLNRDDVDRKRVQNCGATDIGLSCLEPVPFGNETAQVKVKTG